MRELPETLHHPLETRPGVFCATSIGQRRPAAVLAAVLLAATAWPALATPDPPAIQTNTTLPKADCFRNDYGCRHATVPEPATLLPRERPRTLAAVREQKNGLATNAATDAVAVYDAALVDAVRQRWHDVLDRARILPRPGKVILEFNLHPDGVITGLTVAGCEVGEIHGALCQAAVLDPVPYAPWPSEMRRVIGAGHRRVTITFWHSDGDFGRPRAEVRREGSGLVCELRQQPRMPPSLVRHSLSHPSGESFYYGPGLSAWPLWYGSDCFQSSKQQRRLEKEAQESLRSKGFLSPPSTVPMVRK